MKQISLENIKVYSYYDGPLVSLAKESSTNQLYLIYFKDSTPNTTEYFMTPVESEDEIKPFLEQMVSIRNWFKSRTLFNYRITYENLKLPAETYEPTTFDILDKEGAIPDPEIFHS